MSKSSVLVLLYHFLRAWRIIGPIGSVQLLYSRVTGKAVSIRLDRVFHKNIKNIVRLRADNSDYDAFYTVFVRSDYKLRPRLSPTLIFDCGANVGFSTLYFKAIHPDAKIVAIEADKENFSILEMHMASEKNVECLNLAVSSKSGVECQLIGEKPNSFKVEKIESIRQKGQRRTAPRGTVSSICVDDLLFKYSQKDDIVFVKMDIEGSELDVFSRASSWLDRVSSIYIEIHQGCWKSVFDSLKGSNYDCEISGENILIQLSPPRYT